MSSGGSRLGQRARRPEAAGSSGEAPAHGARGWAGGGVGEGRAPTGDLTATHRGGAARRGASGRAQIRAWGPRHLFFEAGET